MLSPQDKEKCAKLYYWATNRHSSTNDWNEQAANLLSELYTKISTCSAAMDLVPRPPGFKPGWGWLVSYVYQALEARMTGSQKIYEACKMAGSIGYISAIEIALLDQG